MSNTSAAKSNSDTETSQEESVCHKKLENAFSIIEERIDEILDELKSGNPVSEDKLVSLQATITSTKEDLLADK